MAGGAVVAFEADDGRAGEILVEAEDVVDLGAAPAVDRLVVVADAADVLRPPLLPLGQQAEPEILGDVGVLVLVDQDELELALVLGQHLRILAKQPDGLQQQVAEIDGVQHLQTRLVVGVELEAVAVGIGRALAGRHLVRGQSPVLPAVDGGGQHAGRPTLLVDVLRLDQLLQETDLVVRVENGESGLQPHELGMAAQDLHAGGVEGAEPGHALHRLADEMGDPLLHLARRLVGEGDGEDLGGEGAALVEDVGDAGGQHPRLAGAGAGQHEDRAVQRLDRRALLGIEARKVAGRRLAATRRHGPFGKARLSRGGGFSHGRGMFRFGSRPKWGFPRPKPTRAGNRRKPPGLPRVPVSPGRAAGKSERPAFPPAFSGLRWIGWVSEGRRPGFRRARDCRGR